MGAVVGGYSLEPQGETNLFDLLSLKAKVRHNIGDICDRAALERVFVEFSPDIVIHMAAQALVRRSYHLPLETYRVNVLGTATVLDVARTLQEPRALLIVTTDKVYENHGWTWGYRENDGLGGHDPYSNSKACSELVVEAHRRSFFSAQGQFVATARAGNVIGGGDFSEDRLVPDAIRSFTAEEPLVLRMPLATRPWQHVLDPLSGYLILCEDLFAGRPDCCEAFNLGPQDEHSVEQAAILLAQGWGTGARVERSPEAIEHHEASSLHLDSTKAARILGWRPGFSFEQAIAATVSFYRGLHDGASPTSLLETDLLEFSATAVPQHA